MTEVGLVDFILENPGLDFTFLLFLFTILDILLFLRNPPNA